MDLLETVKEITKAHDEVMRKTKYQPIHTGARDWAMPGPICDTREEAQAWINRQISDSHRKDDEGHIIEIQVDETTKS